MIYKDGSKKVKICKGGKECTNNAAVKKRLFLQMLKITKIKFKVYC